MLAHARTMRALAPLWGLGCAALSAAALRHAHALWGRRGELPLQLTQPRGAGCWLQAPLCHELIQGGGSQRQVGESLTLVGQVAIAAYVHHCGVAHAAGQAHGGLAALLGLLAVACDMQRAHNRQGAQAACAPRKGCIGKC